MTFTEFTEQEIIDGLQWLSEKPLRQAKKMFIELQNAGEIADDMEFDISYQGKFETRYQFAHQCLLDNPDLWDCLYQLNEDEHPLRTDEIIEDYSHVLFSMEYILKDGHVFMTGHW